MTCYTIPTKYMKLIIESYLSGKSVYGLIVDECYVLNSIISGKSNIIDINEKEFRSFLDEKCDIIFDNIDMMYDYNGEYTGKYDVLDKLKVSSAILEVLDRLNTELSQ